MSNLKKSVQFFTFSLLFLVGFLISTPSFAQIGLTNTPTQQAGGEEPETPETPEEEDPTSIPTEQPCNTVSEVECVPDTPMALTGSITIDPDNDGEGIQVSTSNGAIVGVSLVSPTGNTNLNPFSSCNSNSNSSLWQTSSGNISIFLTSTITTNAVGQTQASVGGMHLEVCLE